MIKQGLNNLKEFGKACLDAGKEVVDFVKEKALAIGGGIATAGASLLGLSQNASAALTTEQQAVVDSVTLMINDMITVAWALVLLTLGAVIGIKIFKKFMNKAT